MSQLEKLFQWFEKKPLILFRFEDGFEQGLLDSRQGLARFTIAKQHGVFRDLKMPTICLAQMPDGDNSRCYVGVVKSKTAVSTFDSRVTILGLLPLNISSFEAITGRLPEVDARNLKSRLESTVWALRLPSKLSSAVVKALSDSSQNRDAIEAATNNIPKFATRSSRRWEQVDAIKTAMAAFGLGVGEPPEIAKLTDQSDSSLSRFSVPEAHVLEDRVIERDTKIVPGFELIDAHVTGRAVFAKGNQKLTIYTANKGPLEKMLGVDLIYINETAGNTLMVQYKMLEPHRVPETGASDWICKVDSQMLDEISRMKLLPIDGKMSDYRLNRGPFYFKFVRRKGDGESHKSIIVSLEHLNHLLASAEGKGPRNGLRVSFDGLNGVYLRESDFTGLLQSGYIGTHRIESRSLHPLIQAVAEGNRAIVLAWQRRIRES